MVIYSDELTSYQLSAFSVPECSANSYQLFDLGLNWQVLRQIVESGFKFPPKRKKSHNADR
ncbi:MAG: hypothetical protein F6K17_08970 [Okeania sp. SIO3C4]|nr:hypothetical protein [Okeania sp. SIO3B3]NER02743.1 hypothetical protein [Okeania sp. SIO3C4]